MQLLAQLLDVSQQGMDGTYICMYVHMYAMQLQHDMHMSAGVGVHCSGCSLRCSGL